MQEGPQFLTGTAGTGKSTLIREWREADPNFGIITASTGVAAVNSGAQTIHSLLKFSTEASLEHKLKTGKLHDLICDLHGDGAFGRHIIIDEISMINARTLDILHTAVDKATDSEVALVLTGDFAQLPPVEGEFAFKASCWPVYDRAITRLTKIWRQTDAPFLDALALVRQGNRAGARALLTAGVEYLMWLDPHFDGITLVATNKEADNINAQRWLELPGEPVRYPSARSGIPDPDWKMIPEYVDIKVGSRVMVMANSEGLTYANGDTGVVEGCYEDEDGPYVDVTLDRIKENVTSISVHTRRHLEHKHGSARQLGAIEFMPLKLAYAITTHKSQGLTFDHVQIDPRHWFAGSPALMYVALSRARTAAGVKIIGAIDNMEKKITVHPEIAKWL